jgi:hypothetical protein
MVDRTPSLENEKVYDRDTGDMIPLSDLHQLVKAVGSHVADVGNGAHHESAAEGFDTLVESTDPDPLNLSRDQVHIEKGAQCRSPKTLPAERKSTGAEVPVVQWSVSVNVTDAVTQSITDDVGMSGCRLSNCKGTGSYCWGPVGISAVNERY